MRFSHLLASSTFIVSFLGFQPSAAWSQNLKHANNQRFSEYIQKAAAYKNILLDDFQHHNNNSVSMNLRDLKGYLIADNPKILSYNAKVIQTEYLLRTNTSEFFPVLSLSSGIVSFEDSTLWRNFRDIRY